MEIRVDAPGAAALVCTLAILVPETALAGEGQIKGLAAVHTSQRKHDFHALAQTALMQIEYGELAPVKVEGSIRVSATDGEEPLELDKGLLIGRLASGEIVLLSNTDEPSRKLLSAALRFFTRWIRLDL